MKSYFLKFEYLIILFVGMIVNPIFGQCTIGQPNISVQAEAFSTITIVEGTSTTLTSPVSGSAYQWTLDGIHISGATSSTLTISNFSNTDIGDYNIIVDSVPLLNTVTLGIFSTGISDYDRDRQALIDFYNTTNGSSWTRNTNWLTGPIETWEGVKVENCRVTELRLSNNNISGAIPASFQNLSELKRLSIKNNDISGVLDITTMPSLLDLYASNNSLTDIKFGSNDLLQRVHIQSNPFTLGKTIDISSMRQLIDFRAARLNLAGLTVSGDYDRLLYFIIADNQISGTLDISRMPNLQLCYAYDNQFTDFNLGAGSELQRFYFYNNPITPGRTMDISGMRKLLDFRVQGLGLSQLIMSGTYDEMLYFIIKDNQIGGTLDISMMPKIALCSADNNFFDGLILPSNVTGSGRTLNHLFVRYNNLHFDDLLPYSSIIGTFNFRYNPQRNVVPQVVGSTISVNVGGDANNTYVWNPSVATGFSYTVTSSDTYFCEVENPGVPNLVIKSDPIFVPASSSGRSKAKESIDEERNYLEDVKVFPNPISAGNPMEIILDIPENQKSDVNVYSIQGKRMKNLTIKGEKGSNFYKISSNGLIPGVYIVSLEIGSKKVNRRIVIK